LVAKKQCAEFYAKLGIPRIISGWNKFSGGAIGGDAENYANAQGALSATLESGSHFDKSSNDVAYKAAVSLLSVLEMVEPSEKPAHTSCDIFEMYDVVLKGADDFRYPEQVRNFQFVKANDVFAFEGGNPRRVPEDSYLLIPMKPEDTKVHEEVCYLGRKAAQA
jgi:succinylglutamate desuccinylase